jgi:PAT family beta-lactamase induction signal transducer AmpG
MLFLGFSAGMPYLLIFSSLSLWLGEAGVDKSMVTYFSWAALGYSFKFMWAPLLDHLPIPFLTARFGRRRGWLLFTQLMIISAIWWMASVDPSRGDNSLTMIAFAAVVLGFSSATQDAVIDAYRIEVAEIEIQTLLASAYTAGYRIGMIASGAGALVLAESFGSSVGSYSYQAWQWTYVCMGLLMFVGVLTSILVEEPVIDKEVIGEFTKNQYMRFCLLFVIAVAVFITSFNWLGGWTDLIISSVYEWSNNRVLAGVCAEFVRIMISGGLSFFALFIISKTNIYEAELVKVAFIDPVLDFFGRYGVKGALTILMFVAFYRISDIVLGVISNVFYQDMGFTKLDIAKASKTFGLGMTILGGFLGGILSARFGVMRILVVGAILTVSTNLLFVLLAQAGNNLTYLYLVISADNLSGGIATTAFIAYLASLTNVSFTAVQYAIFSSLMTLIPKTIGGYSGTMVDNIGYENFFLVASAMGVPVLFIIYLVSQIKPIEDAGNPN